MWDVMFWTALFVLGFCIFVGGALYYSTRGKVDMKTKELTNEELATALRAMVTTGICPSRQEKEFLEEAADRLDRIEPENEVYAMAKKLNVKIGDNNGD